MICCILSPTREAQVFLLHESLCLESDGAIRVDPHSRLDGRDVSQFITWKDLSFADDTRDATHVD